MSKTIKKLSLTFLAFTCALMAVFGIFGYKNLAKAVGNTADFTMVDGARAEVVDTETSGLMFTAQISQTYFNSLKTTYGEQNVIAGLMLAPNDYLEDIEFNHSELTAAYKRFNTIEATEFKKSGEILEYSIVLNKVRPENYARAFSARGYIKISNSQATTEGAVEFNGAYYLYTELIVTRSIYEVALGVYDNEEVQADAETVDFLKTYLNGVVNLTKQGDDVVVGGNTTNYTTPYTVETVGDRIFVDNNGAYTPSAVVYKEGDVIKEILPSDKVVGRDVSLISYNKVASKSNDSITFDAVAIDKAGGYKAVAAYDIPYVAFAGNYGVGNYMEFRFTGNNMPNVMFFADYISGNITNYNSEGEVLNQHGVFVTGGIGLKNPNEHNGGANRFNVYGPNKVAHAENNTSAAMSTTYLARVDSSTTSQMFIQGAYEYETGLNTEKVLSNGLSTVAEYADMEFIYIVGTKLDTDNTIIVDATIISTDGTVSGHQELDTGLTTSQISAGNIIVYSAVKQDGSAGTFKYSKPHVGGTTFSGVKSFNADGSVTLNGVGEKNNVGSRTIANIARIDIPYVGFRGDYDIGTYVDVYYTGNNMPSFMFFADYMSGNITNIPSTTSASASNANTLLEHGVLVSGGLGTATASGYTNGNAHRFAVYGPNKLSVEAKGAYVTQSATVTIKSITMAGRQHSSVQTTSTASLNDASYFCQGATNGTTTHNGLATSSELANKQYKLSVGTQLDGGVIHVIATLYELDADTNTYVQLKKLNLATSLTEKDIVQTTKNLIIYGAVKADGSDTTFRYSRPYTVA